MFVRTLCWKLCKIVHEERHVTNVLVLVTDPITMERKSKIVVLSNRALSIMKTCCIKEFLRLLSCCRHRDRFINTPLS